MRSQPESAQISPWEGPEASAAGLQRTGVAEPVLPVSAAQMIIVPLHTPTATHTLVRAMLGAPLPQPTSLVHVDGQISCGALDW